jgi:hypothetical protein
MASLNLQPDLLKIINQAKSSLDQVKNVTIDQAWKILQLAVVCVIQDIENNTVGLSGQDKKAAAMDWLSKFYDSVFVVINVPFVPAFVQPIIKKYIKMFLMALVSSTIDAMVTTFRNTGVFSDPNSKQEEIK